MFHRDGFHIHPLAPPVMKDHNPDAVYVKVGTEFNRDGEIIPKWLEWEDGRTFEIMRLLEDDGAMPYPGVKYVCLVNGQKMHLIYDQNNRFYVFRKHTVHVNENSVIGHEYSPS